MQPIGKLDNGGGGSSQQQESSDGLRGGAPSLGSCMNLSMYGCLCLYRPQQWKATVLLTVKVCDGPSSEKGPLCPSFCAYVHTRGGGCIFGSDSEVLTVEHSSKPGPFPSIESLCVPTTAVWITLARLTLFNEIY